MVQGGQGPLPGLWRLRGLWESGGSGQQSTDVALMPVPCTEVGRASLPSQALNAATLRATYSHNRIATRCPATMS